MTYNYFKSHIGERFMLPGASSSLTTSRRERDRRRRYVIDQRTSRDENGVYHVKPIAIYKGFSVAVVCPFCGDIHLHGYTVREPARSAFDRSRLSHCNHINYLPQMERGYYCIDYTDTADTAE